MLIFVYTSHMGMFHFRLEMNNLVTDPMVTVYFMLIRFKSFSESDLWSIAIAGETEGIILIDLQTVRYHLLETIKSNEGQQGKPSSICIGILN